MKRCENCPKDELFDFVEALQADTELIKQDLGWLCAGLLLQNECVEPRKLQGNDQEFCGNPSIDDAQSIIDITLASAKLTEMPK